MSSEMNNDAMPESKDARYGRGERGGRFGGDRFGGGRCGPGGRRSWWKKAPLFILMGALAIAIKGALVMVLWNALIPNIFHGPELVYLQAIGLMLLVKLIVGFRGFGGGYGDRFGRGWGRRFGGHRQGWMMKELWSRLPEDERQKLKEEMRRRWRRD